MYFIRAGLGFRHNAGKLIMSKFCESSIVADGRISKPDGDVMEHSSIDRVSASILLVFGYLGRTVASAVRSISTGSVALVPRILS